MSFKSSDLLLHYKQTHNADIHVVKDLVPTHFYSLSSHISSLFLYLKKLCSINWCRWFRRLALSIIEAKKNIVAVVMTDFLFQWWYFDLLLYAESKIIRLLIIHTSKWRFYRWFWSKRGSFVSRTYLLS